MNHLIRGEHIVEGISITIPVLSQYYSPFNTCLTPNPPSTLHPRVASQPGSFDNNFRAPEGHTMYLRRSRKSSPGPIFWGCSDWMGGSITSQLQMHTWIMYIYISIYIYIVAYINQGMSTYKYIYTHIYICYM